MEDKSRFITPILMLFAGAISAIIMYIRDYDLTRMLWGLLIVLIIFYVLGDIARYLYSTIRPRIIPSDDLEDMVVEAQKHNDLTGNVVEYMQDGETVDEGGEEAADEGAPEEEYGDDTL
jgi:divalent metal cation (Fe/Co/Zn/Cd) transporter